MDQESIPSHNAKPCFRGNQHLVKRGNICKCSKLFVWKTLQKLDNQLIQRPPCYQMVIRYTGIS